MPCLIHIHLMPKEIVFEVKTTHAHSLPLVHLSIGETDGVKQGCAFGRVRGGGQQAE